MICSPLDPQGVRLDFDKRMKNELVLAVEVASEFFVFFDVFFLPSGDQL